MRLIQICIVAIAKKASKQEEIRSHRTTRRRYLRWYQAKQRSCWKRGTEILIALPGFFLPFHSRLGSWGLIPLRRKACLCRWQSNPLSAAMTWNHLLGRPRLWVLRFVASIKGISCSLSLPLAGVVQLATGNPFPSLKVWIKIPLPFSITYTE